MNASQSLKISVTGLVSLLFVPALFILLSWMPSSTQAGSLSPHGGVIRVTGDCNGIPSPCYTSVQAAVDAANSGDEIRIASGSYSGVSQRPRMDVATTGVVTQVAYITKTVTLQGGYSQDFSVLAPETYPTTLDAQNQGRVLYITGDISPTIAGLRLTGGNAAGLGGGGLYSDFGGGVYVFRAGTTLSHNWIFSNTASAGGGLSLYGDAAATLNGNYVLSNTAASAGGGLFLDSTATLNGNHVRHNTASTGGGLYLFYDAATLTNNVIADNHIAGTANGSGVYASASTSHLLHTTLAYNTGGEGSGVYITTAFLDHSTVVMANTILVGHSVGISVTDGNTAAVNGVLWHNVPVTVSWSAGATVVVQSEHTGDPAFLADGYHLGPTSAAIDVGVAAGVLNDVDGDLRPVDGDLDGVAAMDLGADEARWLWRISLPLVQKN
jgi:hypothetical protein